jgi:adenine/guanine phosphoribosyltransferase-like PRPP-binding protein
MTARSASSSVVDTDLSTWVGNRFGVTLSTASSPVGLDIDDLVGLALRRNPRRAHLLVSSVLGKHLPVRPGVAVATGRLLGELVAEVLHLAPFESVADSSNSAYWSRSARAAVLDKDPDPLLAALDHRLLSRPVTPLTVLGFAETATSLGHLVADQLHAGCYVHSTRRKVPGVPVAGTFEEGHSHATSHLLLPVPAELLDATDTLVLVDDELSTGTTALGTIAAVHRRRPRRHYVVACLIDLRSPADRQRMSDLAASLECRIDVVSLSRGAVHLPDGLLDAVRSAVTTLDHTADPETPLRSGPAELVRVALPWPWEVPEGGRHGFLAADRPAFDAAVTAAASPLTAAIRSAGAQRVVVLGTEELMYLPLRLAQRLAQDSGLEITFQSTTRSPVLPVDADGYPVRRQFRYADPEGDAEAARFVYNVIAHPAAGPGNVTAPATDPDLVVVVVDEAADTAALQASDGLLAALTSSGLPVLVAALPPVRPQLQGASPLSTPVGFPAPLTGPGFSSYAPDDVRWLLTDLSGLDLEAGVADREAAIQAGTAHYAESLPVEFQPDLRYRELFDRVLAQSARRLALAVGLVTELVLLERSHDVVLASLARAGTPVGILMRRWAQFRHGIDLPHYALSIVRGRGIDALALRYIASKHDPADVVFVDGWTGKGAIAVELTAAIDDFRARFGISFNSDLAVLADPGHCVRTFGTRDDFLIASACLNSTVSGLISRTVLNPAFLRPDQYHGAKFYRDLSDGDVSNVLLDAVAAEFPAVVADVSDGLPALAASDREPTFSGWAAIEAIRAEYGIESVNFVKPGVGETTRVLLRRVPWRILVREANHPDHEHLRLLAAQRNVPVDVRPDLPYSCVGLIRRMSNSEPGEG